MKLFLVLLLYSCSFMYSQTYLGFGVGGNLSNTKSTETYNTTFKYKLVVNFKLYDKIRMNSGVSYYIINPDLFGFEFDLSPVYLFFSDPNSRIFAGIKNSFIYPVNRVGAHNSAPSAYEVYNPYSLGIMAGAGIGNAIGLEFTAAYLLIRPKTSVTYRVYYTSTQFLAPLEVSMQFFIRVSPPFHL